MTKLNNQEIVELSDFIRAHESEISSGKIDSNRLSQMALGSGKFRSINSNHIESMLKGLNITLPKKGGNSIPKLPCICKAMRLVIEEIEDLSEQTARLQEARDLLGMFGNPPQTNGKNPS